MQTIMIVEDDPDIRDGVRIALDCNRVWVDEQEADLTETEYKILKLLMQSPQRIFPVQVIYETVAPIMTTLLLPIAIKSS